MESRILLAKTYVFLQSLFGDALTDDVMVVLLVRQSIETDRWTKTFCLFVYLFVCLFVLLRFYFLQCITMHSVQGAV